MPIKNSQILFIFPTLSSSISLGVTIKPQVKSVVTGVVYSQESITKRYVSDFQRFSVSET